MRGPENPSMYKEYGGKGLKYGGIVAGILGILSLNVPLVVLGTGTALYGRHVENKNKR